MVIEHWWVKISSRKVYLSICINKDDNTDLYYHETTKSSGSSSNKLVGDDCLNRVNKYIKRK